MATVKADTQTYFWLLIIGVLFYFYVDVRINKVRDEMRWHLMYMEQIYRTSFSQNHGNPQQQQSIEHFSSPAEQWATGKCVKMTSPPDVPQERRVRFVDDVLPTQEEISAGISKVLNKKVDLTQSRTGPLNVEPVTSDGFGGGFAPFSL